MDATRRALQEQMGVLEKELDTLSEKNAKLICKLSSSSGGVHDDGDDDILCMWHCTVSQMLAMINI